MFSMFAGNYSFYLNSDDLYTPDLPLATRRAKGGTMAMWRQDLSPYVKVLPTTTSSVLPILLSPPRYTTTAHVTVYLPTSGKDSEFVTALSALEATITDILENHSCPLYLRGDFNVNPNNVTRCDLLRSFCEKFALSSIDFGHPSHHHFTGGGKCDSQLDLLLYRGPIAHTETLTSILCSLSNPLVMSHHDVISSSFQLLPQAGSTSEGNISAPQVPNTRVKILWEKANLPAYESLVSPALAQLRERWGTCTNSSAFSVLFSSTCSILSHAAQSLNKFRRLSSLHKPRPSLHPDVRAAQTSSLSAARHLRNLKSGESPNACLINEATENCARERSNLKRMTKEWQGSEGVKRDQRLSTILTTNPSSAYSFLRSSKNINTGTIQTLSVGDKVYSGSAVSDGFFDSLASLKAPSMENIHSSASFQRYNSDYEQIMKICTAGMKIPAISGKDATVLLHSLRPEVNDLNSLTANHFIHAGLEGVIHFAFLLNCIISEVNLSSLEELNNVWAMILFKGHGKDRESDRSYRTISTCPLLSKAMDKYVGGLCESGWAAAQAETQFQGSGSSHELAAVLLTETIQHSLFVSKKPIFVLLLDAQSAFDKILCELVIRAAFLAGTEGEALVYLNNRLRNRRTFVEWNKKLMGPIRDELGVEQGGVNSDREYKLANNEELLITQNSNLGVQLCPSVHVASVGQADDVALASNCIFKLQGLLHLAMEYASNYHIQMVPEKTKLLCYVPRGQEGIAEYWQTACPLTMAGLRIPFSLQADHVGILRNSAPGNMASVLARVTAFNRALHAVMPAGLARRHRGNPAAGLKVVQLYGLPVLLSGLASLVLNKQELEVLDYNHKVAVERVLRLYPRTPAAFVYLLAGCPPASATLHLRQLSLLGMVARQGPTAILHRYATFILSNPPSPGRSPASAPWFIQVRHLCSKYNLSDPLQVLSEPPTKAQWKSSCTRLVLSFWGEKLRTDASALPSLSHLRYSHMSLTTPSNLLTSCLRDGEEVRKLTVQARMLSGRYRTCWLRRHWSGDTSGFCRVPGCTGDTPGTLLHLATGQCPGLADSTANAVAYWTKFLQSSPHLAPILTMYADGDADTFLAFLLDPSIQAPVLKLAGLLGNSVVNELCHLTRTWLYQHHRARYRALGLWEYLL